MENIVKSLNLASNNIGNVGIKYIMDMLKEVDSLFDLVSTIILYIIN